MRFIKGMKRVREEEVARDAFHKGDETRLERRSNSRDAFHRTDETRKGRRSSLRCVS
ncbi:hypothetical protein [Ureibacillus chungkukjangi]|uniref:Uncharacterized protein n=2 Tax=Ureibacillus chungkukjangi TaxID=1202712 RepID=A0A318THA3_9BACL|nr:hypothetical protein [Ureibacillus chungkukjangi]PYF03277.1 hypothetical protein BJ095_13228 [Ureibacillus chungkukjangi]